MNETDLNALKAALKDFTRELKKSNDSNSTDSSSSTTRSMVDRDTSEGFLAGSEAAEEALNNRLKERLKLMDKEQDELQDSLKMRKLLKESDDDNNAAAKERLEYVERELEARKEHLESQIALGRMGGEDVANEEKKLKVVQDQLKLMNGQKIMYEGQMRDQEEIYQLQRKANRERIKANALEESNSRIADETSEHFATILDSMTASTKLEADPKRGVAGFLRAITFDAGRREAALDQFKDKISQWKGLATKANILGASFEFVANALGSIVTLGFKGLIRVLQAVMEGIVGAVLLFDKLGASIAKTTGHGREFAQQYIDVASTLDATGTTLAEQVEMMNELGSSLRHVGGMSLETMGDFANLGITAKRLGMDIQDLTEITKFQTVGLGRSTEEVTQSISNLNKAAVTMGMDFSDLSKQFVSTQGTFAVFGNRSEKVFLRTMSAARQLGVEMSDVVQLADQFKTFDSAADSVADLNFIMGGQFLDSLELMELRAQGPDAVLRKIKDTFDATGKSFETMSFHEQEALAEAAGMQVDKARNFFMGKVEEDSQTAVEQATQSFNEFAKRGRETMTIMERIGKIAMSVAQQLAKAFGFDKFATGNIEELLTKFETFAAKDLMGKVIPIIRDDIVPMLKTIASAFSSLDDLPIIGSKITQAKSQDLGNSILANQTDESLFEGMDEKTKDLTKRLMTFSGTNLANASEGYFVADEQETFQMEEKRFAKNMMDQVEKIKQAEGEKDEEYQSRKSRTFEQLTGMSFQRGKELSGLDQGGMTLSSGAVMVGENGPEIVVLPAGTTTIPNDAFARTGSPYNMDTTPSQRGQGETKVEVSINVDDRKLREVFSTTVEQVLVGA